MGERDIITNEHGTFQYVYQPGCTGCYFRQELLGGGVSCIRGESKIPCKTLHVIKKIEDVSDVEDMPENLNKIYTTVNGSKIKAVLANETENCEGCCFLAKIGDCLCVSNQPEDDSFPCSGIIYKLLSGSIVDQGDLEDDDEISDEELESKVGTRMSFADGSSAILVRTANEACAGCCFKIDTCEHPCNYKDEYEFTSYLCGPIPIQTNAPVQGNPCRDLVDTDIWKSRMVWSKATSAVISFKKVKKFNI